MKIAIACDKHQISGHFGRCEVFAIYDVSSSGKILKQSIIENPGHRPRFLPEFLAAININVLITGGIGSQAALIFKEKGINVITGVTGSAQEAMELYLAGKLKSSDELCQDHLFSNQCQ
ncbi:MAG: NifB/NifX family molybdenum-iron cluster-binding protein [Bacilli bacterium]|nr:NifB/NifX family molybdenum-iron cluster-binding protein [Bacilli bacterium]MDD4078009.1 NifB/NifX family molybdenum-iron cluster-binding protein [Bacilli bacterium]MDD4388234.1 NifB/NifX family molybdenum-iron cluster-binding protein [Bacilli bacterium]